MKFTTWGYLGQLLIDCFDVFVFFSVLQLGFLYYCVEILYILLYALVVCIVVLS